MYERSKHFFQGNQFKNSHNLFSSQCMDIVRSRNLAGGALQWQCMVLGFLWNKFREYLQIILGNTLHTDNTRCRVIFQYHYSDTKL